MTKPKLVFEVLDSNRNILLGVLASILLIGTCSHLDSFVIEQNNATVGVLSTIGAICAALLILVVAVMHMILYSRLKHSDPGWFIIPILAVALVWTISGAYLIALYK